MSVRGELTRLATFGHAPHCPGGSDDCNLCVAIERGGREAYTDAIDMAHKLVKDLEDAATEEEAKAPGK